MTKGTTSTTTGATDDGAAGPAGAAGPESLTEHAYRALKQRILTMAMPPGHGFTESGLVAELAVGKTPVREALTRLRQEGLVHAAPRAGWRVADVTLKEARDLLATRSLLEAEAARLAAAARVQPERLRELKAIKTPKLDPADPASVSAVVEANTRFHMAIAQMSGNDVLVDLLRHVLERLQRLFHLGLSLSADPAAPGPAPDDRHQHAELVDALLKGEAAAAKRLAAQHAHDSQAMVLNALLASDAVQSMPLGSRSAQPRR